jgi:mono/diheme cytochrome c family protein
MTHLISLVVILLMFSQNYGCRGYTSKSPPVHPNPNMDRQPKYKAFGASGFFENGQSMRMPVDGTVAQGQLKDDEHYYFGKVDEAFAKSFPSQLTIDEAFLKRGQIMFNRTCSVCHGQVGDGSGLVGKRLMVPPPSFHAERMYEMPPGQFFDVISNGIRTMHGYKDIVVEKDRWAITAFVHCLQMSQDSDGEWIKRSAPWWRQN